MNTTEVHTSPDHKHKAELAKILEAADNFLTAGAIIAGGALTSAFTKRPIADVDMYFRSEEAFQEAVREAYDDHMWCVAATDRAATFARGDAIVQLMCFGYFATPADVFDAFDFTACMAAYDADAKQFVFHEEFLKHAAQRHLRFHSGTRYPFGSLLRTLKYQSKGYGLSQGDLLRIALCCMKVPLNSWDDLAKAIGGQYGERVKLDDDRPFSIDAALEVIESSEFIVPASQEAMPGTAEGLFAKLRGEGVPEEEEFGL